MTNHGLPGTQPALLRGLTQRRLARGGGGIGLGTPALGGSASGGSGLGRRDFLRLAGLTGGAALLAACGVEGEGADTASASDVGAFWSGKTEAGQLDFANWPLYMDVGDTDADHPSLDLFTEETGIKVTYREVIQDNDSFFAQIRPSLAEGKPIGHDLMVLTNGISISRLIQLGYLAPLDHSKLPTFAANASPSVEDPAYDPGNVFTVAYQSGFTGIGYDPTRTGREITSFEDLFDPAFAGKVGMYGDNQDLPNLALLGIGVDPKDSGPDDWRAAAAKLTEQRDAGIVRKYYDQSYIDALATGDLWISMAWSGDVFQKNAEGVPLEFVVPKEGGLIWTDNMCIPRTAPHPVDALTYMDFAYRPEIAAMMAEYINYITPVPAAKEHFTDPELATSPFIFPSQADLDKVHYFRVLTTEEETEWNEIFQPVYQS